MKPSLYFFLILLMFLVASCAEKRCDCPDSDLIGKWESVDFISLESVAYSKDDNYSPVIEFRADGSYGLRLDRNSCSGTYENSLEGVITISGAMCTEICCDSDFSEKFATMLPKVESYSISGDDLKLNVAEWGWINLKRVSH